MRWPWSRKLADEEAQDAVRTAEEQKAKADSKTSDVDRKVRAAEALTRRTDRFARDIEQAWQQRREPT